MEYQHGSGISRDETGIGSYIKLRGAIMSTKMFYIITALLDLPFIIFIIYFEVYNHTVLDSSNIFLVFIFVCICGIPTAVIQLIYRFSIKTKVYNVFDTIKIRNEKSRTSKLMFYVSVGFRSSQNFSKLINFTYSPVSNIEKIENENKAVKTAKVTLQDNREYILTFIVNYSKNYTKGRIGGFVLDRIDGLGF